MAVGDESQIAQFKEYDFAQKKMLRRTNKCFSEGISLIKTARFSGFPPFKKPTVSQNSNSNKERGPVLNPAKANVAPSKYFKYLSIYLFSKLVVIIIIGTDIAHFSCQT